jgi:hypothetical protein
VAEYELLLLGLPTGAQVSAIRQRMSSASDEFSLSIGNGLAVRTTADVVDRNIMAATVALYFGGDPTIDLDVIRALEKARVPIVPVLERDSKVEESIPATLAHVNACLLDPADVGLETVSALALECLGLLREQRRIFVSYRRDDSRQAAVQLYDELSARGFDVFLDTHSIRPGTVFQEMLWHRLADCDIVVMFDTKGYFESKWTKLELGRALAHGIHVLRIVWPGHKPTRFIDLSDTIRLDESALNAADHLESDIVAKIASRAEALRSRSIAWRYRNLVAKLRNEVLRLGGAFEGVGSYHSVSLSLPNGMKVQAYPAVGVPSALVLNEIHTKVRSAGHGRIPCLVYDDTGIRPAWLEHMAWLEENITGVKAVKVARAAWEFAGWDV